MTALQMRLTARRFLMRHGGHGLRNDRVASLLGYRVSGQDVVDSARGFPFEYDPRTDIGGALFARGAFEEADILAITRLLAPITYPVILDVGANIGVHSVRWARALPGARVFSFEPSPTTAQLLQRNIERCDLAERVEVIEKAVSEKPGSLQFFECTDDAYSSLRDTRRQPVADTYAVEVTTVDEFIAERALNNVDLIKIDVEGFEDAVLRGSVSTLRSLRPILFVEIYGGEASNPDPEGTIAFVVGQGYRASVVRDGVPTPYVEHSDRHYNYLFEPLR